MTPLKGNDHNSKFLLTHREREVFELLVQDKTTRDIAGQLFISEKTVRNHISNVMQKLNVKGRSQAVVELIKLGELKI
ncbi:helix-turn-helix transcriptional regulator [Paenibacillus sp. 7541]|uniref:DNA-binding response regulator n=1 Tax=Paenibacillus campinasensis TaxID=66347 RepID=A0ABW9T4R1_9BACL|nr:DNA-binding response regulator [Paenibacillus campinasensis]PAK48847.1 helix-turn-helix transcriptional regulator [Paenibacillus sp. 7541]